MLLALTLGPLVLLALTTVTLATRAVERRVEQGLGASADLSALYILKEMQGVKEVADAFAHRPLLVRVLSGQRDRLARGEVVSTALQELSRFRQGIGTAFLTRPDGRLIDIVPPTPSIVGKDFSFRDWYRGVRANRGPYVSDAYESQATGHPHVVAVATPVRTRSGKWLGILTVAYRMQRIQDFARRFTGDQGFALTVTDQRGVLLASPRGRVGDLVSQARDPRVVAALAGHQGLRRWSDGKSEVLSAYRPIRGLGWTVIAEVPEAQAFADVARMQRAVFAIGGALGIVLLGGIWLINVTLRGRQDAEERVAVLARTDWLTGVANRREWDEALHREMARARREQTSLFVALLDLDHFKDFNDLRGHQAGDRLLVECAAAWRTLLREYDVLARYGGEEFGVALPSCTLESARMVIERLRDSLPSLQTCSAGIAHWDGEENADALVARADQALYEAKRSGRDRAVLAVPTSSRTEGGPAHVRADAVPR
jgi:diguanylate cyclase (GGDEF)-like protein